MNKRGETAVVGAAIFIVLVAVFVGLLFISINKDRYGASMWEEVYAKRIAQAINMAREGDKISIDVQKASEVALKNDLPAFELKRIVTFDSKSKEVIVKLRQKGETRFGYFNDVVIVEPNIELGIPGNVLFFSVKKSKSELLNIGGENAK